MYGTLAIPLRYWIVFKGALLAFIFAYTVEPVIFMAGFGFGLRDAFSQDTQNYTLFVISGMMVWIGASVAIISGGFECHRNLYDHKIWQAMMAASLSPRQILMGELLGIALRCTLAATLVLLASFLFGQALPLLALAITLPLMVMTYLIFISWSFIAIGIIRDRAKLFLLWALVGAPALSFGNTVIPIERYPDWIRPVSYLMPSTHSLGVIRQFLNGAFNWQAYVTTSVILLLVWFAGMTLGTALIQRRLLT